jgi:hypothetical protein
VSRHTILFGLLVVLALTGSAGAPSAPGVGAPSAEVFAIQVSVPGAGGATAGALTGPPNKVVGGGFVYPGDASIVSASSVSSRVAGAAAAKSTTAGATVQVSGLSLFGGEITVSSVIARASAEVGGRATGRTTGSSVNGLVVLGQAVGTAPGAKVPYGSWGSVYVLEQSAAPYGSGDLKGFQAGVTALVVHLDAEHLGVPAGTDIVVGYVDVSAEMRKVQPAPKTTTLEEVKPKPKRAKEKEDEKKQSGRGALPPIRQIPFGVSPKLTAGRYVFPVYGAASYTDSFGAPRAAPVGWHHGEDIFAPLGAPILAVADGIVYSVGWNDLGGLRLWLQDRVGNEFYYAHLSAFSPLAVNGAQVRAGDVLGFMGNTGDAESTPYHLHFEIHPASLMFKGYDGAVAPYPYLNAWRRLQDLPLTVVSGWAPPISDSSNAPRPGAILLQARDISSATGLDPGSLRRAMRPNAAQADGALAGLVAAGRGQVRELTRAAASGP